MAFSITNSATVIEEKYNDKFKNCTYTHNFRFLALVFF